MPLKVKSQSLAERCEICHKTDCFEPEISFCSRCNVLMKWQEQHVVSRSKISRPASVQVEHNENQLKLIRSWQETEFLSFLVPTAILSSGLFIALWLYFIFYIGNISNLSEDIISSLLLFSFLMLIPIYCALTTYKNQTIVLITDESLSIKHVPLPWPGNTSISTKNIKQLYTKVASQFEDTEKKLHCIYEIRAKLIDNKDVKVLGGLIHEDVSLFLKQQIEDYLGIIGQPIDDKIEKYVNKAN